MNAQNLISFELRRSRLRNHSTTQHTCRRRLCTHPTPALLILAHFNFNKFRLPYTVSHIPLQSSHISSTLALKDFRYPVPILENSSPAKMRVQKTMVKKCDIRKTNIKKSRNHLRGKNLASPTYSHTREGEKEQKKKACSDGRN